MYEDGDEAKYFGEGRQAEVGWLWHDWRLEVERRVIACEAAIRLSMEPEDALATLVDALRDPMLGGSQPSGPVETEPLVEVVPSPVAGTVTVDLTPVTGGVFGVAPSPPPRGDGAAYEGTTAHRAEAAAAAMSTPTKSARKRAVRVSPVEARLRVKQALTSAQSTIREITAWETATDWGIPLTSSQVRPALTELEKRGEVHVVGKRGKQEIWAIKP